MKKSDVTLHRSGYGGRGYPAVRVKCYDFGGDYSRNLADVPGGEKALEWCWESHAECFWENASDDAQNVFGPHVKVYSEGRSGGWLIVQGLPDVEDWDAIALGRWARFEKWVKSALAFYASADAVRETIEANDWLPQNIPAGEVGA